MTDKKDEIETKIKEIHNAVLSDDEKAKIEQEVEKELAAEAKKKIKDDYKEDLKQKAKKRALFSKADPGVSAEGLVSVFIDIPRVTEAIRLDGKGFLPGRVYNVKPEVAAVLYDVMGHGKAHEDEIRGNKNSNSYRARRHDRI